MDLEASINVDNDPYMISINIAMSDEELAGLITARAVQLGISLDEMLKHLDVTDDVDEKMERLLSAVMSVIISDRMQMG